MERDGSTLDGIDKLVNGDRWTEGTYGLHEAIKAAVMAEMQRQDRPFSSESYKNLGSFCGRMARKIIEHEAFDELWRRINERAEIEIASRVRQYEYDNASKSAQLSEEIAKYLALTAAWTASDETTRRFDACRPKIEALLPIQGDHYTKQQAIRSRGLVMAALFGMRQMGSQGQTIEDAIEDAKEATDGT